MEAREWWSVGDDLAMASSVDDGGGGRRRGVVITVRGKERVGAPQRAQRATSPERSPQVLENTSMDFS